MQPHDPKPDDWLLAQGERDGYPMIVRMANTFSGLAPLSEYNHHVIVSVRLRNRLPNGLPSSEEGADLEKFEVSLCGVLEQSNNSLCVLVITNNGLHDFIFYTRDVDDAKKKLEENLHLCRGFQVEFAIEPDADWRIYRAFSRGSS